MEQEPLQNQLAANLAQIRRRIDAACARVDRAPDTVRLLPATKYAGIEVMHALLAIGLRSFGENQVKMAEEKAAALGPEAQFHLIGHLQRNKVKRALRTFRSIQSLDSLRLAEEVAKRMAGSSIPVLLEVNVGGEEQKHGFLPGEVFGALEHLAQLPALCVEGFMAVPPYCPDPAGVRPYFRRLREIRDAARQRALGDGKLETLSMGMSADFEVAVEEGATIVRVGSVLFSRVDR